MERLSVDSHDLATATLTHAASPRAETPGELIRVDAILETASPAKARAAFGRAETELEGKADAALGVLSGGWEDANAVLALPAKYRRRMRTSNMIERFIEEIRRREKVIRIFPNEQSVWRLVGALCTEQHEEWGTGRRYLKMDEFYRWKASHEKASHEEDHSDPQPLPLASRTSCLTEITITQHSGLDLSKRDVLPERPHEPPSSMA